MSPDTHRPTVLVVDDEVFIRMFSVDALSDAGYKVLEAGRGFAVVADLVSALAMRAEEEAKRARNQLSVTQTYIVTAVEAVHKVDGAFAHISGDVAEVHALLATMAADNQAQAAAITEISAAVGSMDHSTQQNAAMVEQTSAAARNLVTEVTSLTEQARRFTTGSGTSLRSSGASAAFTKVNGYGTPVKRLPPAAIPHLVRDRAENDSWKEF